jgi:hypothetical protein
MLLVSLRMQKPTLHAESKFTFIGFSHKDSNYVKYFDAVCVCGNKRKLNQSQLLQRQSCGCTRTYDHLKKHMGSKTAEYKTWQGMRQRCNNSNDGAYSNYGERGIRVCDSWNNSFENFLNDMGKKPSANYTLDRIDVEGNYTKENCRWADKKTQGNNRRNNIVIEYNGIKQTLTQWANMLNVNPLTMVSRNRANWPIEKMLREYTTFSTIGKLNLIN